jgi:hypothetical protein
MLLSGALPRGVQAHRCQDWAAPTQRAGTRSGCHRRRASACTAALRTGGEHVTQAGLWLRGGRRGRGGCCRATQVSVPPEQLDVPRGETAGAAFLLESVTVQARPPPAAARGPARRAAPWHGVRAAQGAQLGRLPAGGRPGPPRGRGLDGDARAPRGPGRGERCAARARAAAAAWRDGRPAPTPLTPAPPRRLRQEHAAAVPDRPAQCARPRPCVHCSVRQRATHASRQRETTPGAGR